MKKRGIICASLVAPFAGAMCPFRHISGEKTVVCKHWLRGLCKKGDQCEFLHEYDMTKMPECYFYSKFGLLILHCISACICTVEIVFMFMSVVQVSVATRNVRSCTSTQNPKLKIARGMTEASANMVSADLGWYCHFSSYYIQNVRYGLFSFFLGPDCRHRHTRRVICVNYLVGFCPEGKSCKFMQYVFIWIWYLCNDAFLIQIIYIVIFFYSPRFELPMGASEQPPLPQQIQNQSKVRKYTLTQLSDSFWHCKPNSTRLTLSFSGPLP